MLVSDIDGTLLKDGQATPGLDSLRVILESQPIPVYLVYATGRPFDSTWSLVESEVLPRPRAVAAFVGTEVWLPPWREPDPRYRDQISANWNRSRVLEAAGQFEGLELQPEELQTPIKVSFFIEDDSIIPRLKEAIRARKTACTLIYSAGRYLDVLPARAGKRAAVEYLRRLWEIPPEHVLAGGDSGNDLDMLENYLGVSVANAKRELRRAAREDDQLHQASLPYAAGILEGAEKHEFWEENKDESG